MQRPILMTGGGTGGTIIPLLAVADAVKRLEPQTSIRFLVTRRSHERSMIERAGFSASIFPAGKWRRYLDWRNVSDLFVIAYACIRALILLLRGRPAVIVSVGSFLSVPVVWVAGLLRIPVLIHQQDIEPGLATRLMRRAATAVTVATDETAANILGTPHPIVTGNPVRAELLRPDAARARRRLGLEDDVPTVCIIGGSSGARAIDDLLGATVDQLVTLCQVVHIAGANTQPVGRGRARYHHVPFVETGIGDLFAVSDLIVTRAGFSTLSEIAAVGRPCIVIPMPETHQTANADYFVRRGAALMLDQTTLTPATFLQTVSGLLRDRGRAGKLATAMTALARPDAADRIARVILAIAHGDS